MNTLFFNSRLGRKLLFPFLLLTIISLLGATVTIVVSYKSQSSFTEQPFLLAAIILILLICVLIPATWFYILKKVIYPLNLLQAGVTKLAQEDAEHSIQIFTNDELEDLAKEINTMAVNFFASKQVLAETALENEHLYQEEQRRVNELNLINQINHTLLASVNFEVTIDAVLRNVKTLIAYNTAEINIWQEDRQIFDAYAVGDTSYTTAVNNRYTADEGYTGWIFRHRQALVIPDLQDFSDIQPKLSLTAFPFKAYIGLPLMVGQEFLGTLELTHLQPNTYTPEDVKSLTIIANQAAVALKHAKLLQENGEWAASQVELAEIASLASTTLNLYELMQRIMHKTINILGAQMGAVLLLNKEETELYTHPAGIVGFTPADTEFFTIPTNSPRFHKTPFSTGNPFLSNNVQSDEHILSLDPLFAQKFNITNILVVPLRTADRNVGELYVANKATLFTQKDLIFLSSVAVHFASAILNASLFETTQKNLADLSILYQSTADISSTLAIEEVLSNLAERMISTLPADECAISLYRESSQTLEAIHENQIPSFATKLSKVYSTSDYPVTASVLHTQQPALITLDDPEIDKPEKTLLNVWQIASVLMLPLLVRNQTIGLVELYAKRAVTYQPDEISLVQTLANQAAIALHNAQLFREADEQLKLRVKELSSLQKITQQLNSTLDLKTIIQLVIKEAVRATGADFGNVHLYDTDTNQLAMDIPEGWPKDLNGVRGYPSTGMDGIIGRVRRTKRPEIVDEVAKDPDYIPFPMHAASEMVVPILYGDVVEGIINLESTHLAAFTQEQLQYVKALADQATLAIHNAKEYAALIDERRQATTRIDQLARLSEISRAFRANLSLESILEDIAFAIQETVGFNAVLLSVTQQGQLYCMTGAGVPINQLNKFKQHPQPISAIEPLLQPEFRVSDSFFIPVVNRDLIDKGSYIFTLEKIALMPEEEEDWQPQNLLFTPLKNAERQLIGLLVVTTLPDGQHPPEQLITTLEIFANQAMTAIENSNLFQEIQHRVIQLKLFGQISAHISAILNPTEILSEVVNLIANAFDYYYIQIYQIDEFDPAYMVSKNGIGAALSKHNAVIPENRISIEQDNIIGWVVKNQKSRRIIDVQQDPLFDPNPHLPETRAEIALPLRAGNTIFGVLDIQHDQPNAFVEDDVYNLQALADQLAVATQNARLFAEALRREQLSSALGETGLVLNETLDSQQISDVICREALRAFQVHGAFLWLVEGKHIRGVAGSGKHKDKFIGQTLSLSAKEALVVRIIQSRQAQFIHEADFTPNNINLDLIKKLAGRAILGAPLIVGDRTLGAIILLDSENPNRFDIQDQVSATLLANQAAIAIDNARLFEREQRRADQLNLLNQTGQAINATTNLDTLMNVIYEQLGQLMNVDNMFIARYHSPTNMIDFPLAKGGPEEDWQPRIAGNGLVEYIITHKKPLLLNENVSQRLKDLGIDAIGQVAKSWIGVPMIFGDTVLGVIALQDYDHDNTYSENMLNLLSTIAAQVAIALQNIYLLSELEKRVEDRTEALENTLQELRQERDRVDILYHIAQQLSASLDLDRVLNEALHLIGRAVHISQGSILLISPTTDYLIYRAALGRERSLPRGGKKTQYKIGIGLAGHVLETRQPRIVPDLLKDNIWISNEEPSPHRSALAVPLITAYEALGVLLLFHNQANYFTKDHLSLVTAAAPMIATAISNADLYTLITEQSERVGTLLSRVQNEANKNETIIESIADGVLVVDANQNIQLINPATAKILECAPETLENQKLANILTKTTGPAEKQIAQELYKVIITQQYSTYENDEPLTARINAEGKAITIILTPITFTANHHIAPSTLVVLRDISREAELDRIKDEFISTVSHELRTPMTPIKGYTDLLVNNKVGPVTDMQRKFLQIIKANADRLDALVNDILDISRIDAGRVKLVMKPVDLAALIQSVVLSFEYQLNEKNLSLTLNIPDNLPPAYADPDRVIQILVNLIGNGTKYTRPEGSITIDVKLLDAFLHVIISDTGLGISEEDQKHIFERFFRAERDIDSLVDGTGLGLPIAKTFVNLMGGEIWVKSELGVGTTFGFTLPLIEQPVLADPVSSLPSPT